MSVETGSERKKRFKVPHTYVILFSVVILATIMTYVLPAGVYDRYKDERTGRTLVDATSYHHVERTPVSVFKMFESLPKGMKETAEIIFFIFICGGAFSIIQATGAIDGAIGKAVLGLKGKEKLMIPITMLIFSIGGATYGMA
ncbi:MAG: C4-dicarboxylate ABC transporter permease, partial [Synergistaceae bacterium]|nr:C4-dicarboxylate ABC transporter permease [Synergistaceae bacterium]